MPELEGLLNNDSLLGTDLDAEEQLALGDAALQRAREAGAAGPERRERIAAFEAWHSAVASSQAGARVRYLPGIPSSWG